MDFSIDRILVFLVISTILLKSKDAHSSLRKFVKKCFERERFYVGGATISKRQLLIPDCDVTNCGYLSLLT